MFQTALQSGATSADAAAKRPRRKLPLRRHCRSQRSHPAPFAPVTACTQPPSATPQHRPSCCAISPPERPRAEAESRPRRPFVRVRRPSAPSAPVDTLDGNVEHEPRPIDATLNRSIAAPAPFVIASAAGAPAHKSPVNVVIDLSCQRRPRAVMSLRCRRAPCGLQLLATVPQPHSDDSDRRRFLTSSRRTSLPSVRRSTFLFALVSIVALRRHMDACRSLPGSARQQPPRKFRLFRELTHRLASTSNSCGKPLSQNVRFSWVAALGNIGRAAHNLPSSQLRVRRCDDRQ